MYRIANDQYNWILQEVSTIQKEDSANFGKESVKNIGYFGTVESLKAFAIERSLKIHGLDQLEKAKADLIQLVGV